MYEICDFCMRKQASGAHMFRSRMQNQSDFFQENVSHCEKCSGQLEISTPFKLQVVMALKAKKSDRPVCCENARKKSTTMLLKTLHFLNTFLKSWSHPHSHFVPPKLGGHFSNLQSHHQIFWISAPPSLLMPENANRISPSGLLFPNPRG